MSQLSSEEWRTLIAWRIRKARREQGFSQNNLAVALGLHPMTVSKWERCLVTPSLETLVDVEKVLGVRKEWILTGEGEMNGRANKSV
jgi:transcriptional regulator with XRE-family HTH domain